jgi:HPt (histidine-containing phosphotransfer) domain-containing protein
MNECKKIHSLFLEYFYGEPDASQKKLLDDHMSGCEKCRSRFAEMEAVLRFTGQRVRPEPPEEFWDSYEQRLEQRIETEESSGRERELAGEKPVRRFRAAPKWAFQAGAAVALIIIGMFIGRLLFFPRVKGVQHASRQPELTAPQQPQAILVNRSQDYIERSKLILLALVNFDSSIDDPYALDLPLQKQVSTELLKEAHSLKTELAASDQERLENLIASLEIILLQIANLESENDLEAIELVRDGIQRRGILLEINLTDLRLFMNKEKRAGSSRKSLPKSKTI